MTFREFWGKDNIKGLFHFKKLVLLGEIILVIILIWLWWANIYSKPQSTFWSMFNTSLETVGVTRHVVETVDGGSLNEYIQLELGGHNLVHGISTLSQNNITVTTETIGTPYTDYTRYTNIKTKALNKNGQPVNFSSILNVWGESAIASDDDPLNHLFGQTILGLVPIANMPAPERGVLIKEIRDDSVFAPDFKNIKHGTIDKQAVYIYQVSINPEPYAQLMTNFAKDLGFDNVPELNPANYENGKTLTVDFAINPASRQLIEINYPGSNHSETYSGYGLQPTITLPTKTITTTELEQRLAAIH
jgi:hypothetical protein